MKSCIHVSIILLISLSILSCSKSKNEVHSLATVEPKPEPTSIANPPNTTPPIVIAPQITAQMLATNLTNAWNSLKTEFYETNEVDPESGTTFTKIHRLIPSDTKLAFCFPDYKNEQIISNFDPYRTGFELASVSKIFTSLWAVQALKRNYVLLPPQFKSVFTFHHETGELFIKGSLDPMFGIDRLVDALKNIQYKLSKNDILEFSPIQKIHLYNFIQLPIYTSQTTYELTVKESALALATSPTLTKKSLHNVAKYLQKEKNIFFEKTDLNNLEIIPHTDQFEFEDAKHELDSVTITSYQRPLNQLLFFINTYSHNLGSDLIFQLLGGRDNFYDFLLNYYPPHMSSTILHGEKDESLHLGYDSKVPFAFYNGSGLPQLMEDNVSTESFEESLASISPIAADTLKNIPSPSTLSLTAFSDMTEDQFSEEIGNTKFRNKATCEMMFKAIEGLYNSNIFLNTTLEELMPINGNGTLKRSISESVPKGTFVGKSGSLNNLLTLVGALKTRYGMRPFFISIFRNNLDGQGNYRSNGLSGKTSVFVRSKVTTELIQLMLEYYSQQGFFLPSLDLLSQLNAQTFLARSYIPLSSLF